MTDIRLHALKQAGIMSVSPYVSYFKLQTLVMEKFQEILTQAAQLKEAQLKKERKNFESLPQYLKAGLNYAKKYETLRKQPFMIQLMISEKLKKAGNALFKQQKASNALDKYQEALGIFRYISTKTWDNLKDQDLVYQNIQPSEEEKDLKPDYDQHLIALYLNICSCLTKLNRKDQALHSAQEALKIKETAKGYYKKAQAYLQYINRDSQDIKLGFYYLNKCYEISKDDWVLKQMHATKKEIDEERSKNKQWFKFMFDKNKEQPTEVNQQDLKKERESKQVVKKEEQQISKTVIKNDKLASLQRQAELASTTEDKKLIKTKEKLEKYLSPKLSEQAWLQLYQGDFIARHGSKVYSILQLYASREFLNEYRPLLAQCLEVSKEEAQEQRREAFGRYFTWLEARAVQGTTKYVQRFKLQTNWIRKMRKKASKEQKPIQKSFQRQEEVQKVLTRQQSKHIEEQITRINENNQTPTTATTQQPEQQPIIQAQSPPWSQIKRYSFFIALLIILILKYFI